MALPQDGQDANGLTKVTQIPAGKELMFIDPTTNEGGIITLEDLTKQILNGLTSQTFGLDSGTQTLPAAINYLYGKIKTKMFIVETEYGNIYFRKSGNSISVYGFLENLPANAIVTIGNNYTDLKPNYNYAILDAKSAASPYTSVGSAWVYADGNINLYKPIEVTRINIAGCYVVHT